MTRTLLGATARNRPLAAFDEFEGFFDFLSVLAGHLDRDFAGLGIDFGDRGLGLSTAYLLGREGKKVIVLDDGPIAGGQSQRTSAHLSSALDDRFYELEKIHGAEGARLAAESHAAAIEQIDAIVAREHIPCDFERVDGYLFVPPGHPNDVLDRELGAGRVSDPGR